jgi:hypothetical protein
VLFRRAIGAPFLFALALARNCLQRALRRHRRRVVVNVAMRGDGSERETRSCEIFLRPCLALQPTTSAPLPSQARNDLWNDRFSLSQVHFQRGRAMPDSQFHSHAQQTFVRCVWH